MTVRLGVHLGREGPKSVEIDESRIEVTDDFVVVIENHGPPQHVHIAPAADLSRFVSVDEPNHFIEADDAHALNVTVREDRPVKFDGHLRIVTGYGTEESFVEVGLREEIPHRGVRVDESLGRPRPEPTPSPTLAEQVLSGGTVPLVALAAIAVFIAVGAILIATELAVVLGALAVLVGVGIAVVLLIR